MLESHGTRGVEAPFAQSQSVVGDPVRSRRSRAPLVWGSVIFVLLLVVVGIWIGKVVSDPFRTLEPFPVATYYSNFGSLKGARFKGELIVEADLGYQESTGRMMVFKLPDSARPLAVLLIGDAARQYYTKGQRYVGELEVNNQGVVYSTALRKR